VALANVLCHEVLGRSLDDLPPQTRKLLFVLKAMVKAQCEAQGCKQNELLFSRRDALLASGMGLTQLRAHLERLVELELVLVHRGVRGQSFLYELLWDGEDVEQNPKLPGLLDVSALGGASTIQSWRGLVGGLAGGVRGDGGPVAGGWRPPVVDVKSTNAAETQKSHPKLTAPYRSGGAPISAERAAE
jgi:hypothetical protein